MPQIPNLPNSTPLDDADYVIFEDNSTGTTRRATLTALKTWMQSLVAWINPAMISDNAVTATKIPDGAILLGIAQITSNFSTTTTPTEFDVTGLSLTVTVPNNGRKLLLVGFTRYMVSSATGGTFIEFRLKEGATRLQNFIWRNPAADYGLGVCCQVILTPSAGSHTYKVSGTQGAAGTYIIQASAQEPAYIAAYLL